MNKILKWTVIGAIVFLIGWVIGWHKAPKPTYQEPIHHWHTEIQYDTVDNVQLQTKYVTRHDTVILTAVDTIIDSVLVDVPIHQYSFDTAGVRGVISGFNVSLDSMQVEKQIQIDSVFVPYCERKWRFGPGFALGFGWIWSK